MTVVVHYPSMFSCKGFQRCVKSSMSMMDAWLDRHSKLTEKNPPTFP